MNKQKQQEWIKKIENAKSYEELRRLYYEACDDAWGSYIKSKKLFRKVYLNNEREQNE